MKVKITKKENVKVDGVKYLAVPAHPSCLGCAFEFAPNMSVCRHTPCVPEARADGRNVIFIQAQEKAA